MQVRRALTADFPGIVQLQDRFLADNVAPEKHASGFLSHRFSEADFEQLNRDLAVIVAIDESGVCAFLCGSDLERMYFSPIVFSMMTSDVGVMISMDETVMGGPICIDERARGHGLASLLYDELQNELQGSGYTEIVIFIDHSNVASFKSHNRIGFEVIGEFTHEDQRLFALARPLVRAEPVKS